MSSRIKDIAEYVKLSPATVSMILNNRPGFSEETRAKVIEAAKSLNYQLSSTKRIAGSLNDNLPFVIFKRHGEVIADTPFFASLIEAIEREAKNNGYNLSVHYMHVNENAIAETLRELTARCESGILVLATEMEKSDCEEFDRIGIPYVLIDNAVMGISADKVLIGNCQGAYVAVNELYNNGHRKIGYIHSSVWISNFEEREAGYIKAMQEKGLAIRDEWIAHVGSTHDAAYQGMQAYCERNREMPTAFFADNDIIAMGAIKALRERDYRIPEDVSLIGFDDTPYCTMVVPNLSTMRVDTRSMGGLAVKLLLEKNPFRQKIEVETQLIRRQSVRLIG